MIPFNKPLITGTELTAIDEAIKTGKISGNGKYTKLCESFFERRYGFKKALLTSSCTGALEMAALLINIKPGDEVIMPTYTFVSMANAFILRGAKIIFADSSRNNPNIDADLVEDLITPATKAIVVVHYSGIACNLIPLQKLAAKYKLYLIEDAAHAIDSFYNKKPLGSFGHLATFSFHETKNITCGEGGLLVINDAKLIKRAEIIRENGTNRSSFLRKEVAKYNWIDVGSSFLPSDILAAFLYAQLNKLDTIQQKRKEIWDYYYKGLEHLQNKKLIKLPYLPAGAAHNSHIFYFVCNSLKTRTEYINHMLLNKVQTQFHYLTLHNSPFYKKTHGSTRLPNAKLYQDCLVRLPMFYNLSEEELNKVISLTCSFFLENTIIK